MTGKEILDLKLKRNDAKAKTVRAYLKELLATLWDETESFSGKRPFGNSGWEYELYSAFGDPEAEEFNRDEADAAIHEAIVAL